MSLPNVGASRLRRCSDGVKSAKGLPSSRLAGLSATNCGMWKHLKRSTECAAIHQIIFPNGSFHPSSAFRDSPGFARAAEPNCKHQQIHPNPRRTAMYSNKKKSYRRGIIELIESKELNFE